jgi:hypothetical protein
MVPAVGCGGAAMDIEFFDEFDLGDLDLEIDDFGIDEEVEEIDDAPDGETTEDRAKRILKEVKPGTQRLRLTEQRHAATREEDYYRVIYFRSDAQAVAYCRAKGWPTEEIYLRGLTLAEQERIVLPEALEHGDPAKKVDPKLAALAQEFDNGQENDQENDQSGEGKAES